MPRNGSGTYTSPAGQPVVTGTVIDSTVFNNNTADVASALTGSLAANGEKTSSANQPMGGFRHTGVGDSSSRTSYPSTGQLQDNSLVTLSSVFGTDTITAVLSPAITAYVSGMHFVFVPANSNTGAATININGIGAKSIVKGSAGSALTAADLFAGVAAVIVYNGTSFYLMNPSANVNLSANYTWTGNHTFAPASGDTVFTAGTLMAVDGTAARPFYSFNSDNDTGLYRISANRMGVALNGVLQMDINLSSVDFTQIVTIPAGSATNPSLTFTVDPDTGVYRSAANEVAFTTAGVRRGVFFNSGLQVDGTVYAQNGLVGTPSFTFTNDASTGVYLAAAGDLRLVCGGALVLAVRTTAGGSLVSKANFLAPDGTNSAPSLAIESDPNTGLYSRGADRLGMTEGGTGYDVGYRNVPQNSQSANYTLVQADSGKHILHPSGGGAGDTFTIPANASVAYDIGTVLTFVNADSNSVSIAITTDTLTLAGTTTTGTRTLGQNGIATAIKVTSTGWIISGTALT